MVARNLLLLLLLLLLMPCSRFSSEDVWGGRIEAYFPPLRIHFTIARGRFLVILSGPMHGPVERSL